MKYTFSVIIPTYNGATTIYPLLSAIAKNISNYTSEMIIIDSGSTDGTLSILKKYKEAFRLRIIQIQKKDFDHGDTRNMGVRLARGTYVCFFSQDVMPVEKNIFNYYLEDFQVYPEAVAVFSKNIPYPNANFLNRIDHECRWERLDKYVNSNKILVQSLKVPFTPYTPSNYFLWYFLGNTASCFKRDFLIAHPFARIAYGEDLLKGKQIIEEGFMKIYDARCTVFHSHEYTLGEYYQRQSESLNLRYNRLRLKERGQLVCKIKKIISAQFGTEKKIYYLVQLVFFYFVKLVIFARLVFSRRTEVLK